MTSVILIARSMIVICLSSSSLIGIGRLRHLPYTVEMWLDCYLILFL